MITKHLEVGNKKISVSVGDQARLSISDSINRKNTASIVMSIKELKELRKLIKQTIKEYKG